MNLNVWKKAPLTNIKNGISKTKHMYLKYRFFNKDYYEEKNLEIITCSRCWSVNLYFYDFSFNYFSFFTNSDSDRFSKSLCQSLGFIHFQTVDFRTRHRSERSVRSKWLSDTHGDGSLSSSGGASNQYGLSSNFTLKYIICYLDLLSFDTIFRKSKIQRENLSASAMAVFPVSGEPAIKTAFPAILPKS